MIYHDNSTLLSSNLGVGCWMWPKTYDKIRLKTKAICYILINKIRNICYWEYMFCAGNNVSWFLFLFFAGSELCVSYWYNAEINFPGSLLFSVLLTQKQILTVSRMLHVSLFFTKLPLIWSRTEMIQRRFMLSYFVSLSNLLISLWYFLCATH